VARYSHSKPLDAEEDQCERLHVHDAEKPWCWKQQDKEPSHKRNQPYLRESSPERQRSGAETSLRQTLVGESLAGVTVADIMTRDVLTVPPTITVQQLVSDYFLVHHHEGYPVVKDGEVFGLVTLQSVRGVPKEKRDLETVQQAMVPSERTLALKPSASALDAMQKMASNRAGQVLVVDQGRLLGVVTREDVMRTIQTRQELELGPSRPSGGLGPAQFPRIQAGHCIQCGAL